ncbi:hypothetical protein ABIE26_003289 [Pedobacter africanus]|uniref:Uncharacterized protein n=1 Tax=Pedobacter africanus TaxID=151894 RepID=A0ACC6KZT6_9SPHI|nr:hypothetical protein [Pedobacter africanus]MDR6784643.1 hypothetical protein [Pedobacter africanus]
MKTKILLMASLMLVLVLTGKAQKLLRANFVIADYKTGIQHTVLTYPKFVIGMDADGNIAFLKSRGYNGSSDWGDFEDHSASGTEMIGNLKVTYYGSSDRDKEGKIKSVEGVVFNYYDRFDIHDGKGKLKAIGDEKISYNNAFDIHEKAGTLKSVGNISIKYNNAFDIHEIKGTVKSVGQVKISYYNKFDAESLRGKIRSVKGNSRELAVTRL